MVYAQSLTHLGNVGQLCFPLPGFATVYFIGFSCSASTIPAMSFICFSRTCLIFLSILAFVIASPCQQKRDISSLDLFSSGETPLDDESLTLAYAMTPDADFLSSDDAELNGSIFSSSIDGSSLAAVDGVAQKIDPDNSATTSSTVDGGASANSESLFPGTDSGVYSGPTLIAEQLPNFGGITDFSFKDLENEKSCPADEVPTTQSGRKKVPDITNEIFQNDDLTPEDKRRCPAAGGKQPVALCCISIFEKGEEMQRNCYRSTSMPQGLILFYVLFCFFSSCSIQTDLSQTRTELTNPVSSSSSSGAYSHRSSIHRLFGLRIQLGAVL